MERMGIGVGIMVLKDGRVLLGRRNDDPEKADSLLHGEGQWTMPGGKLGFGESLQDAARRELLEETGLKSNGLELMSVTNDIARDAHFVTIGFLCREFKGEPKSMEPEEITEWRWFPLDALPENMFSPTRKMAERYLKKSVYEGE